MNSKMHGSADEPHVLTVFNIHMICFVRACFETGNYAGSFWETNIQLVLTASKQLDRKCRNFHNTRLLLTT